MTFNPYSKPLWLPKKVASAALALIIALFSPRARADEIANLRSVAPGIFAGANPIDGEAGVAAFQDLVSRKVTLVIDLQGTDVIEAPNFWTRMYNEANEKGEQLELIEVERTLASQGKMNFINLPINSNNPVSDAEVARIDAILDLLAKASVEAPIYIHCEHGADRTGLIIALFRVLKQGISIDEANNEWTQFGPTKRARFFYR